MKKLRIGLFFGGRSAEHEISVISARNIANALDKNRFEPVLVGITNSGKWILFPDATIPEDLKRVDDAKTSSWPAVALAHFDKDQVGIVNLTNQQQFPIDVGFPIMHGPYGEDGSIQGLFRTLGLPFVGCGVLSSAIGMDKDVMKRLLAQAELPMARYVLLTEEHRPSYENLVREIGVPFFIKPANMGSSIGVFKIKSHDDFETKIKESFQYDTKVIAEEFIQGREIEVAVLGLGSQLVASPPGEIIPQHEFYSYEAKYLDEKGAILKVPAELSQKEIKEAQDLARQTFVTLGCEGMARVDFFLSATGNFFINEINTIPGFTSISQYPMLMKLSGFTYPALIEKLVDLALEKRASEMKLKTVFPGA